MPQCRACHRDSLWISQKIGFCIDCIRGNFAEVWPTIQSVHRQSRWDSGLPPAIPQDPSGLPCPLCVNQCRIAEGERGYCGLRANKAGKLVGGGPEDGNVSWYHDPLPTNCVADWVCAGGTGAGYPLYAYHSGPEYGYKNLAVFYQACSFNCLFCQNWQYRRLTHRSKRVPAAALAEAVDDRTACICYFGGDPTPQLAHSLAASRQALARTQGRVLRICWETNGSMNSAYLEAMADLALRSGGCIKFDLKAWHEEVHLALCGITNQRTLENFRYLAKRSRERAQPPLLMASTLLVPGYMDVQEVEALAHFIASLNPDIPYALLAFHPQFYLDDLPTTSKSHALECQAAAQRAGLQRVKIGNIHLLGG